MDISTVNRSTYVRAARGVIAMAGLALLACTDTPTAPAPTYKVGGTVTGLAGTGLVLRDNGGDDLAVTANGAITFATALASGAAYTVTVFTQPGSPAQTCVVTGGSGIMASANVTTVGVVCTTDPAPASTYKVGGTVTGLAGTGLALRNNGGDHLAVTANGSFSFATPLASGAAYSVKVLTQPSSPAQTCVITGGSGTISSGNVTTVAIACVTNAGTGAVRVTVATTGPDAPATDTVVVDPDSSGSSTADVPANGTVSFNLAPGDHTVSLTVARNCTVTSPHPVTVTVVSGATTDIAFSVACVANGTLRVTVVTTGPDAPATLPVGVDPGPSSYAYSSIVPSIGTVSIAVAPGTHRVFIAAALRNCRLSANDVSVTVVAGATTDVAFSVSCVALGTIKVTMATTGTNAPADYLVKASEIWHYWPYTAFVPSNGTVSFKMPAGSYSVKLTLPLNCTLQTSNPGSVTVASGATTSISFSVTCGPPPTLRVTASTTGRNAPATFTVGVYQDGFRIYSAIISPNGTVSQILRPGRYVVYLLVPLNCTVTSPNDVGVILTIGATTDLGFTVTCQ